jgi:hypothetical protein
MWLGKRIGTDYIPDFDAGTVSVVFETEVERRQTNRQRRAADIKNYARRNT